MPTTGGTTDTAKRGAEKDTLIGIEGALARPAIVIGIMVRPVARLATPRQGEADLPCH